MQLPTPSGEDVQELKKSFEELAADCTHLFDNQVLRVIPRAGTEYRDMIRESFKDYGKENGEYMDKYINLYYPCAGIICMHGYHGFLTQSRFRFDVVREVQPNIGDPSNIEHQKKAEQNYRGLCKCIRHQDHERAIEIAQSYPQPKPLKGGTKFI